MSESELGPLAGLVGIWEGDKGDDRSPDPSRGDGQNSYRERIEFVDMGVVDNHEQRLRALRYKTTAWRIGEDDPFHEELGYWYWDAKNKQVARCFIVPRGVTTLAGGTVEPGATSFELSAKLGSPTYGICSNPFLDQEFKTTDYHLKITVHGPDSFSYEEDAVMEVKGRSDPFHHTDRNTLKKIG